MLCACVVQCIKEPGSTLKSFVVGETPAQKAERLRLEAEEDADMLKKKRTRPDDIPFSRYLHWAAHNNDLAECNELLASGEHSPDAMDGEGLLPLHYACKREGTADVIDALVRASKDRAAGAEEGDAVVGLGGEGDEVSDGGVNTPTGAFTDQFTPLQLVASYGDVASAHVLVHHGANLNSRDKNAYTPLIAA